MHTAPRGPSSEPRLGAGGRHRRGVGMWTVRGEPPRTPENLVVAVVGATGALGLALSRELAPRGARLVLTGRDPAPLQERTEELPESASTLLDLGDPHGGDRLLAPAQTAFGRPDVLVNTAGIVAFGPLADTADIVIRTVVSHQRDRALVARAPMPAVAPGQPGHGGAPVGRRCRTALARHGCLLHEQGRTDPGAAAVRVLDVRPPVQDGSAGTVTARFRTPVAGGPNPHAVARTMTDALDEPKRLQLAAPALGTRSSAPLTLRTGHVHIGSIDRRSHT